MMNWERLVLKIREEYGPEKDENIIYVFLIVFFGTRKILILPLPYDMPAVPPVSLGFQNPFPFLYRTGFGPVLFGPTQYLNFKLYFSKGK